VELLTLKEIAKQLELAESTARYFRDKWPEYIPTVKVGRRTFYQPEAVEVLRLVAEAQQKRRSAAETQSLLNSMFAVNIEPAAETQRNNATEQQSQYLTDKTNLKALAQANKEIIYLRGIIERLLRQNQELAGRVMQLEPVKSSERRPGLWQRIFKGNS
jgi:DNA-binding transcriptional MerR regulator